MRRVKASGQRTSPKSLMSDVICSTLFLKGGERRRVAIRSWQWSSVGCQVHVLPVLLHRTGVQWRVHFAGVVMRSTVNVAATLLIGQVVLWPAATSVPPVVAASPGHISGNWIVKVVHRPSKHYDVVNVEPEGHDSGRITDTCTITNGRKFAKVSRPVTRRFASLRCYLWRLGKFATRRAHRCLNTDPAMLPRRTRVCQREWGRTSTGLGRRLQAKQIPLGELIALTTNCELTTERATKKVSQTGLQFSYI